MSIEGLMTVLIASSIVTSLLTQVIKKTVEDFPKNVAALLVGIVSGIICAFAYAKFNHIEQGSDLYQCMGILAALSGIGAMIGYDKVKQTLEQIAKCLGGD